MKTVESFSVDHDRHPEGIYPAGTDRGIYTYDLRFKKPNAGDYLSTAAAHTIEHVFATEIRKGDIGDKVVYFGPMGCRTGFNLLLRATEYDEAVSETIKALKKCLEAVNIPGSARAECGNFLDHDLEGAKNEIRLFLKKIEK